MKKTEDETLNEHRATVAYDILKDTANALQARYIALARAATDNPEEQQRWSTQMRQVRDALLTINPRDAQAATDLSEQYRAKLRDLHQEER